MENMKYLCVDYWYIVQQLKDDILTVTKKGPLYCLLEIETKCLIQVLDFVIFRFLSDFLVNGSVINVLQYLHCMGFHHSYLFSVTPLSRTPISQPLLNFGINSSESNPKIAA